MLRRVLLLLVLAAFPFLCRADSPTQEDLSLVDPELSNTPLPKFVLPPEPPRGLRLPEAIAKDGEWKGVQCAVLDERQVVFRHADKWAAFWEKGMAPYSPRFAKVPPIDFDKDMVVGVFLGAKDTPNFEIEIRSIRTETRPEGKTLVIRYKEVHKMLGVFVPPFSIQPFHLKRVPAFAGPVVFEKVKR